MSLFFKYMKNLNLFVSKFQNIFYKVESVQL